MRWGLSRVRSTRYTMITGAVLLVAALAGGVAAGRGTAGAAGPAGTPRYAILHTAPPTAQAARALPTWTFSYTYQAKTYNEVFVGTDPATGGGPTTIPTEIIPIQLTYGTFTTDPEQTLANGRTPVSNTVASPVFQNGIDFQQDGVDLGRTQYVDAYQRDALWGSVQTDHRYHVLLGEPTIEPLQSWTVPATDGSVGRPLGAKVLMAKLGWFDRKVQALIASLQLPANTLPIVEVTQTYLLLGGNCCVGGYHNYNGTQAYAMFSYLKNAGTFAEDVSALSHEVGEYVNDPLTNNTDVPLACGPNGANGRVYEVGDPLVNTANFGNYPYELGSFTYHLQDLVTPVYFGAPTSTSLGGRTTFQGTVLSVCQNGG